MGHDVTVVVPNDYPDFLRWMKSDDKIINFSEKTGYIKKLLNKIDIIFCLDFNNLKRINELGDLIQLSNAKKVLIDHHLNPCLLYTSPSPRDS